MISLSAAATAALLQQGAKPAFTASLEYDTTDGKIRRDGASALDLTHIVTGFPALRASIRPTVRIPELSGITVKVFNHKQMFNVFDSASWVGDTKWHRARLTVKMGVEIGQTEEVQTTWVAELDDVISDLDTNTIELSFVDPFARLRGSNFGNAKGSYGGWVPTAAVRNMLEQAGFENDLDDASFKAAVASEEAQQLELAIYNPGVNNETWWDAISFLLAHTNRGLFWGSTGKIHTYRLGPTIASEVFAFNRTKNAIKIKAQNPGGSIINQYNIFVQIPNTEDYTNYPFDDTSEAHGRYVEKLQSSIDVFGLLQEDVKYAWTWDPVSGQVTAARNQVLQLLDVTGLAPKVFTIEATLDTFVVELWDYVRVIDSAQSIDVRGFVFDKSVDWEGAKCTFRVFNIPLNAPDPTDPTAQYLQTNNGQLYDDGELIAGSAEDLVTP